MGRLTAGMRCECTPRIQNDIIISGSPPYIRKKDIMIIETSFIDEFQITVNSNPIKSDHESFEEEAEKDQDRAKSHNIKAS
jgi:hypothetical protein